MNSSIKDFFIKFFEKEYTLSRCRLIKSIEENSKLLAVLCWCFDIDFKKYSFNQFSEYLKSVTLEEFEEYFKYNDKKYQIIKDNQFIGCLEFDDSINLNNLTISKNPEIFKFSTTAYRKNSNNNRKEIALSKIWVYPLSLNSKKNTIKVGLGEFPTKLTELNFQKNNETNEITPDIETNLNFYRFYLGPSQELDLEETVSINQDEKLKVLLKLFDIMADGNLTREERLRLLKKYFHLDDPETIAVVDASIAVNESYNRLINDRIYEILNIIKKQKKEKQEKDQKLLQEQENIIKLQNEEIAQLKEEIHILKENSNLF